MIISHAKQAMDSAALKRTKINHVSPLRMRIVQDAGRFLNNVRWLKILMYVSLALGAILVYADVANNLISYGACFIAAAELFVLALLHISFQSRIAKRPLPQFNKKGAGYDEN